MTTRKTVKSDKEELVLVADLQKSAEESATVTMSDIEELTKLVAQLQGRDLEIQKLEKKVKELESGLKSKSSFDLKDFIQEVSVRPDLALDLVQVLGKITKTWEVLGTDLALSKSNEVVVPPNMSAKEFLKGGGSQPYASGWRLCTIFGQEVALIVKDTPKYRILIEGEVQADAPFVQHAQKVEKIVKDYVIEKIKARGYIPGC